MIVIPAIIPIDTISKEVFTYTLASSIFWSEKLFPKKRWIPVGTPTPTITTKMPARETTAEEVPITSTVVILDMISQKAYAENPIMIFSINRYAAPFPTSSLLNISPHFLHPLKR